MFELNKIYLGDCLEVMRDIPDGSVDAIITDPPYGTTACKWDSVIPFEPMWEQLKRIIKPKGAIVLFGSEPFSSALRMSNIKNYKYDWVWEKTRPTNIFHAANCPLKSHEDVVVFSAAKIKHSGQPGRMQYFPQGVSPGGVKTNNPSKGKEHANKGWRPSLNPDGYETKGGNYPRSVIRSPSQSKAVHPTQKPVALLEYLIRTYTNEGETVLDFTIGSGTTAVYAINTGRNFIGIEKDEKYFDIANKRIKDTMESN